MPTYEYRCKDCGHELEVSQSFHDDPLTECPTCGGALRKKFSAVGISFKGSGFYKTDSRGSSSASSSSSSSDSSGGSSSAGSTASSGSSDSSGGSSSGGSSSGGSSSGTASSAAAS